MNIRRPRTPALSLASIARSIFDPPAPKPQPREQDGIEALRRLYPLLFRTLQVSYAHGMLNAEQVDDIKKSIHDVNVAFADIAQRRRKLGEAYDIKREDAATLKVRAENSLAVFNEHLGQIAELASRLRDGGWLEETEYLSLLDVHEFVRRAEREILVYS